MNGNTWVRVSGLAALLLLASQLLASQHPARSQESTSPLAQIRSQADFGAYLRKNAGSPALLGRLSPGVRERLVASMDFGRNGLTSFDSEELAYDLTQPEIDALLGSFGLQKYAPKSRLHQDGGAAPPTRSISALERRFNAFYVAMQRAPRKDEDDFQRAVLDAFDMQLSVSYDADSLSGFDDHDLILAYRGVRMAAGLAPQSDRAAAYARTHAEMERRGLTADNDALRMRDLLLTAHRFEEAREFTAAHGKADLPPLPEFRDTVATAPGLATVWRLSADGTALTRTPVDLAPLQILVTAGCHFSQDAANDISGDPILGPAFAEHARWLVEAPGKESIEAVKEWNIRFPKAQAEMIHDRAEWTIFPDWRMPVFYIVRDGKVLASLSGWAKDPPEEFRQPLIDALRKHGLLETSGEIPQHSGDDSAP